MTPAQKMLAEAIKDLGMHGRPNTITRAYAKRNGTYFLTAPWCNQAVSEWARRSGNAEAVLPNGDRAYTVYAAQDGQKLGRWHAGTVDNIKRYAKPGALIFFDWGLTNTISAIDHIGLVEKVLPDGRVQTLEGNSGSAAGGAVMRHVRAANVIAGFWNPDYEGEDMPSAKEVAEAVYDRLTGTVTSDVWAAKQKILDVGQKLDPKTAIRQIWAYTKDGYAQDRKILAQLATQNATIKALADALAKQNAALNVDELMDRIKAEIEQITVHLDAGEGE